MNNYISIENAKIGFRNFSGRASQYNAEGQRNFCVFLTDELAADLADDGWNVKMPKDVDIDPLLQVSVKYGAYPPNINLISGGVTTKLTEETVGILDSADIENVDVRIRPYNYEVNGKKGIKAYVKDLYVTIEEDPFARKYRHGVEDDF